jgi:hypothetical protein
MAGLLALSPDGYIDFIRWYCSPRHVLYYGVGGASKGALEILKFLDREHPPI